MSDMVITNLWNENSYDNSITPVAPELFRNTFAADDVLHGALCCPDDCNGGIVRDQ